MHSSHRWCQYSNNCAIWYFCTITGVKYIKICTLFKHTEHSWCKNCAIWCFRTKLGPNVSKYVLYLNTCVHWAQLMSNTAKTLMLLYHNWGKMYQNMYFLYLQWPQRMSNTAQTVPFDAFWPLLPLTGLKYTKICTSFKHTEHNWCQIQHRLCHLMLFDHNWAQRCQDMYLFMHVNHKWCQIKQILCFLMRLDHNWGQIYQNMYFI